LKSVWVETKEKRTGITRVRGVRDEWIRHEILFSSSLSLFFIPPSFRQEKEEEERLSGAASS